MRNRLFAIALSLVMVVTLIPFASFADAEENAEDVAISQEMPVLGEDPDGQTPDPDGQTPDPDGQTPDPDGQTPDPDGQTPDPGNLNSAPGNVDPAPAAPAPQKAAPAVKKPAPLKLKAPKGSAAAKSKTSIRIQWSKVKNAKGYKVYRYNAKKKRYVLLKTIKSAKTCSIIDKKLKVNSSYKYKVRAYGSSSGKTVYSPYSGVIKGKTKARYKVIRVKAWAYTGGGRTATGKKAKKGYIAVDPRVIKLHSKVYVPGYGYARAEDTGGNIKGKKIDCYFSSRKACFRWGARYVKVKVYY